MRDGYYVSTHLHVYVVGGKSLIYLAVRDEFFRTEKELQFGSVWKRELTEREKQQFEKRYRKSKSW